MNKIIINVETKPSSAEFLHPPQVVIQENNITVVDMPADEFVSMLKLWIAHQETCKS